VALKRRTEKKIVTERSPAIFENTVPRNGEELVSAFNPLDK
jgi:hypothetical protein